jgi:uncharacterized HAD superfamily protein
MKIIEIDLDTTETDNDINILIQDTDLDLFEKITSLDLLSYYYERIGEIKKEDILDYIKKNYKNRNINRQ